MPQIYTRSTTILPAEVGDGVGVWAQSDEFGAQAVRNEEILWSEQGTYFKCLNPTLGTGLAMGIQTTFSDTANVLLMLRNGSTTKKIIPHYIRLICTAVGATSTSSHMAVVLDTANRYSTGGTDLLGSIVNSNTAQATTSAVDLLRFNCTALAAIAKRPIARSVLKTQVAPNFALGDEFKVQFGSDADQGALSGAAAARYVMNVGPIILGGQNHCILLHMWNPANATTPPSWEFEIAWWER